MITKPLKTFLHYIWNALLIGLVIIAAFSILPRIFPQMIEPAKGHATAVSLPLTTHLQGIGLLLGIATCVSSLMSFCWWSISRPIRLIYTTIFLTLLIGTIINIATDIYIYNRVRVSYHDYLTFIIVTSLFLAPLIGYGRGYPQIFLKIITKNTRENR